LLVENRSAVRLRTTAQRATLKEDFNLNKFDIMSQDNLIKMRCKECKQINYNSYKNKKTIKEKIELKKHCRFCKKHTDHVEMKGK